MSGVGDLLERLGLLAPTAKEDEEATPADPLAAIGAANKRLRDTATWLLTSFAAVGAILVAGLQLADVGDLSGETPNERVVATLLGLAVAALGVALAIGYTGSVLAPFFNSFASADKERDVTRDVLDNREVIGYTYDELKQEVATADVAVARALAEHGVDSAEYKEAHDVGAAWERSKQAALTVIGAEILWRRYKRARRAVIAAVFLVFAGSVAFAWGANPPEGASDAPVTLAQAPLLLDVELTDAGVTALEDARGCGTAELQVLSIGGKTAEREVVTVPASGCKAVRFVLTPSLGTATAAEAP